MSQQALDSAKVRDGLRDVLPGELYEGLRERAGRERLPFEGRGNKAGDNRRTTSMIHIETGQLFPPGPLTDPYRRSPGP